MIYRTRKDNKKYVSAYKYKHNGVLHRYTLCRIIWLNNYLDNLNFTDFSEVDDVVRLLALSFDIYGQKTPIERTKPCTHL